MASTTNYNWVTPDDSSLVKDGASAIRTLGSSVDTTVKALNPETTLGDISYRSSTANTNTRLGIGTTGQVLTVSGGVPAWSTPASAGGMTLLSTTTLTGSSVTLNSISQDYIHLVLTVRGYRPTVADGLRMELNADSGTRYNYYATNNSANGGTTNTFNSTSINVIDSTNTGQTTALANIEIFDYTNSSTWKLGRAWNVCSDPTTSTSFRIYPNTFVYNQTPAITSLKFYPGSGSFTSGTILLYGVK